MFVPQESGDGAGVEFRKEIARVVISNGPLLDPCPGGSSLHMFLCLCAAAALY